MGKPPLGARKDDSWYAMCTEPSITKTPIGPVQVPVPYQVISDLSKAIATASTVFLNGRPAFLLDMSMMAFCTGDEQGSSGGTRSGTTSQEVKPSAGSSSVKANGKSIIRRGDPCTLNKENCKGKFITAPAATKEYVATRTRVQIISSQKMACPDGTVELKAISTPPSSSFDWSVSEPFEIVDVDGNPVTPSKDTVHLRVKDTINDGPQGTPISDAAVYISVSTISSNGEGTGRTILPIHKNKAVLKWEQDVKQVGEAVLASLKKAPGMAEMDGANQQTRQLILKSVHVTSKAIEHVEKETHFLREKLLRIYSDFSRGELKFQTLSGQFSSDVCQALKMEDSPSEFSTASSVSYGIALDVAKRIKEYHHLHPHLGTPSAYSETQISRVLGLLKRFVYGRMGFQLDGDNEKYVAEDIQFNEKPYKFNYGSDSRPLVVVPGMNWDYDHTKAMQLSANYSFAAEHSVRIRNYTANKIGLRGDIIQSAFYELFGGIDPHAIATAAAISEGIRQRHRVYVVAHSQGSEIAKQAFDFILLMTKLPKALCEMIFDTDIFHLALRLMILKSFPPDLTAYLLKIPSNPLEGLGIKPKYVIPIGRLDENKRRHIYYQGFGSETYIYPDRYGMTWATNSRASKDPIPHAGDLAKEIAAGLDAFVLHEFDAAGNKLARLENENWNPAPSRVKVPWYKCCSLNRHDWLTNYWPNLKVPAHVEINETPDTLLEPISDDQFEKLQMNQLIFDPNATHVAAGFSSVGPNKVFPKPKTRSHTQQDSAIAIFFDGAGNIQHLGSNISRMQLQANACFDQGSPSGGPIVRTIYRPGPERLNLDFTGQDIGAFINKNIEFAYENLIKHYNFLYDATGRTPKIDIYGFARGGFTAARLAWRVLQSKSTENYQIRFMGLFDAIYPTVMPSQDHSGYEKFKCYAPNIQRAAHLLAGQETRCYLRPAIFKKKTAKLELAERIFPGVQNDVGGGANIGNSNIAELALTWMIRQANSADIHYLDSLKMADERWSIESHDMASAKPGHLVFPDGTFRKNPMSDKNETKSRNWREQLQKTIKNTNEMPAAQFELGVYSDLYNMPAKELFKDRDFTEEHIDWLMPANKSTMPEKI